MAESYPLPLLTDKVLPVTDYVRAVKRAPEIVAIKRGVSILEKVYTWVRHARLSGRTEQAVAVEIAKIMRQEGAEALAFPVIVASGPGSADIHHWPTKRRIRRGDILMIDCGAVVHGYCSDCTRTFYLGKPSPRFVAYYLGVLKAQGRAIAKVRDGINAKGVDRAARGYLDKWRWGRTFRHGCGHGVGTAIHEVPNLKPDSPDVLRAGMVVTVEPGIYIKDWGGIRIEDMIWVGKGGSEVLTKKISKQLSDVILLR